MDQLRLLDLFCGAGGAAMGYSRAGFDEIVGVDIKPQPGFPFRFVQADALDFLKSFGSGFDAIHASPPCQRFTQMSAKHRGRSAVADGHPDYLVPVRVILQRIGRPFVIENVVGARRHMGSTVLLHGGMFGLSVHRPRLFHSNIVLIVGAAKATPDPIGVYGSHPDRRELWRRTDGTRLRCASSNDQAAAAMGIDWMTEWRELCEAIPPTYTEYIGRQLLEALR